MKIMFGFLWKRLSKLWRSNESVAPGIDSHKWANKIEIFRNFKRY
jgi:hypothetical protein